MTNRKFLLALAVAVAGSTTVPAMADTAKTAGPTTAPSQLQAQEKVIAADAAMHPLQTAESDAPIRGVIAELTTHAMTPKDMDKLVSLFPEAQQKRIAQSSTYSQNYGDKLDAEIQAVNKTWKERYGHDFASFKGQGAIGSDFFAIQMQNAGDRAKSSMATLDVKGFKNGAELKAKLIRESGKQWKMDVPSSLTAQKLRENLTAELTSLETRSKQWPSEQYDAYRMVTRHVMMAVLDRPLSPMHAQAQPAQSTATANQQNAKAVPTSTVQHHWWQFWNW